MNDELEYKIIEVVTDPKNKMLSTTELYDIIYERPIKKGGIEKWIN